MSTSNAGVLNVKLSMTLISISSIHLLKTFISPDQNTTHTIMWQVIIHVAFLVSAIVMAVVDRLTTRTHPEHFESPRCCTPWVLSKVPFP